MWFPSNTIKSSFNSSIRGGLKMKRVILSATNMILAVLLASSLSFAAEQKVQAVKPAVEKKIESAPAKAATQELLDINTATEDQLKKIPGIGDEFSRKIIAGRPYVKKDQLKSRKIITPALYDKIKDKIIAKQPKVEEKKK
jgi:DNA uptake protein ComE-like DNA-binding protein